MASRKVNKNGKRKLPLDSVAAAALDALFPPSDDDIPILIKKRKTSSSASSSTNSAKKKNVTKIFAAESSAPNSTAPRKSSIYVGISYYKDSKRWGTYIFHDSKRIYIGSYTLETDAALSVDEATRLLKGPGAQMNFATLTAYENAKTRELDGSAFSNDVALTSAAIVLKVKNILKSRVTKESTSDHNSKKVKGVESKPRKESTSNRNSKEVETIESESQSKTIQYSSFTGVTFRKERKQFSAQLLFQKKNHYVGSWVLEADAAMAFDEAAKLLRGAAVNFPSRQAWMDARVNELTKRELISRASVDNLMTIAMKIQEHLSKIPCPEIQAINESMSNKWALNLHQKSIKVLSSASAENIRNETSRIKEFPPGCPVLWNLDGNSFRSGIVTSMLSSGNAYKVTPNKHSGEIQSNETIPEKELIFGPNCPVRVSSTLMPEIRQLEGKILLCTATQAPASNNLQPGSYLYTILINKEENQFEVMKDIPSERVKFRAVVDVNLPTPKLDEGIHDKGPQVINLSQAKLITQHTTYHAAAQENDSQTSSRCVFSSNSTITTAYSQRADDISASSLKCRVYIPSWLVRDGVSKHRLQSHLLRVDRRIGNEQCLQRIGRKTNCTVNIIDEGRLHVLIQTKTGKHASEDVGIAAEKLGDDLLEYLSGDGSIGRLFYDLAMSCKFLHQTPSAGGSVLQRNPFTPNHEMGWMNMVELPFSSNHKYHGHFILSKKAGVLPQMNRLGCEIKLCGNQFKVPTYFCKDYIWVIGDQPGQVDMAVGILQGAIQKHIMRCGCRL